jgi:hypothetical protein
MNAFATQNHQNVDNHATPCLNPNVSLLLRPELPTPAVWMIFVEEESADMRGNLVAAKYAGGREGKDCRVEQPIDRYRNAMKEENNVVQTGLPEVCCKKVKASSLKTRD